MKIQFEFRFFGISRRNEKWLTVSIVCQFSFKNTFTVTVETNFISKDRTCEVSIVILKVNTHDTFPSVIMINIQFLLTIINTMAGTDNENKDNHLTDASQN